MKQRNIPVIFLSTYIYIYIERERIYAYLYIEREYIRMYIGIYIICAYIHIMCT